MKKTRKKIPVKPVAAGLTIAIVVSFLMWFGLRFLRNSEYFTVLDIIMREPNIADLSYLKGKNIWTIDLNAQSAYILSAYPDYRGVRITRVLPDRLFVDFVKRIPVAAVKLYRSFLLDQEGVLFYSSISTEELDLPLVTGLETKIFGPRAGKRYNIKEVSLALEIAREAKKNKSFRDFKIKRIDVSSMDNAAIFIPIAQRIAPPSQDFIQQPAFNILEVKLGENNIRQKLLLLAGLLGSAKNDVWAIKYIDLRFKDPVIKLKNDKSK